MQKTYTIDFLSKKRVDNKGHAAQYYVEDSHPAIISKEEFAAAQAEFKRRSNMRGYSKTGKSAYTSEYAFSGKVFCQNCGSKFRRSAWVTLRQRFELSGEDTTEALAWAIRTLIQDLLAHKE